MSKKIGKPIVIALFISTVILVVIIAFLSIFFVGKFFNKKTEIENVTENYTYNNIQNIPVAENATKDDLILKIDGENVLGVITIDKIDFEGFVYEGTSDATLEKGVGHFESSPFIDGNVCLAAHNTKELFGNLHTLQNGDTIKYVSFLGTKEYTVDNIVEISETDWSLLENTKENKITLITCIKDKPFLRLCVQASENL